MSEPGSTPEREESGAPVLRLIVGLGNPGEEYRETRHNVGFLVLAELTRRWRAAPPALECNALVSMVADEAGNADVLLVRPQTFMNRSGLAIRCLLERRRLENGHRWRDVDSDSPRAEILIVYDEVSLPLGRLRLRMKGGPGGHRGMESAIENLRTQDVARLRCGVGPQDEELPGDELVDYVLGRFPEDDKEAVREMVERAADACEAWAREGAPAAMSRFNARV